VSCFSEKFLRFSWKRLLSSTEPISSVLAISAGGVAMISYSSGRAARLRLPLLIVARFAPVDDSKGWPPETSHLLQLDPLHAVDAAQLGQQRHGLLGGGQRD